MSSKGFECPICRKRTLRFVRGPKMPDDGDYYYRCSSCGRTSVFDSALAVMWPDLTTHPDQSDMSLPDLIDKQRKIILKEFEDARPEVHSYLQGYYLGTLRGLQEAKRLLKEQDPTSD